MMHEQIALYEATIERKEKALADLRLEQRRLVWVLVATLAIAPVALVFNHVAAAITLGAGAALFCVGHYIVLMHIQEDTIALRQARAAVQYTVGRFQVPAANCHVP